MYTLSEPLIRLLYDRWLVAYRSTLCPWLLPPLPLRPPELDRVRVVWLVRDEDGVLPPVS
jgi:hypothetical protein